MYFFYPNQSQNYCISLNNIDPIYWVLLECENCGDPSGNFARQGTFETVEFLVDSHANCAKCSADPAMFFSEYACQEVH